MGDERLMVVSSDTHVGPRPEDLRPYCQKKYLERFDEFAASEVASAKLSRELFQTTFSEEYRNGFARNDRTAGHYDVHARLRDMDRDGVAGEVIFHNSLNGQPFPFELANGFGNGVPTNDERELVGAGREIYNRWLADFCSVEPERHVGLAQLPMWDIDAAIRQLELAAESGLRGVNFPAPGAPGMALPSDPDFENFFAACAALDMTLATHIGAMPPSDRSFAGLTSEAHHQFALLDVTEWGLRTLTMLTLLGTFERHPNLKLVITEYPGVYWNELNAKMDSVFNSPAIQTVNPLPRPPSEYPNTNVWIGNSFQSRLEAMAAIEIGREDRYMWGSDYPHPEGTFTFSEDPDEYPMTRLSLASTYHGLPLDKVRKLVGENALDCYPRLDGAALGKVGGRIGPTVEEISTAPALSEHSVVTTTGTLGFRTQGAWS